MASREQARTNTAADKNTVQAKPEALSPQAIDAATLVQQAKTDPRLLPAANIARLQRSIGNQAINRLISSAPTRPVLQPKLRVGPANDAYEQEADHVAAQVMSAPAPSSDKAVAQRSGEEEELQAKFLSVAPALAQRSPEEEEEVQAKFLSVAPALAQRSPEEEEEVQAKFLSVAPALAQRSPEDEEEVQAKFLSTASSALAQRSPEEEEEVQAKFLSTASAPLAQRAEDEEEVQAKLIQRSGGGFDAGNDFEKQLGSARGGGSPLPSHTRDFMEQRMGADFSGVKVHTDGQSDKLNQSIQAKAFTTGQDVFFQSGAYQPDSSDGKSLLAHELTHVIQQGGEAVRRKPALRLDQMRVAPTGRVQRLWNKATFKEATYQSRTSRRGKTLAAIEALIVEYGSMNPFDVKDLKSAQDLLLELREHTNNWLADNNGEESLDKRESGMKRFLDHLNNEEIPKLAKVESDITKKSNTTGGTLQIPQSTREGKLQLIKDVHEGTAKSMLSKVGWMIDASVPNPGDKSKLDIEVKIPVEPSGVGFIGFHLVCSSDRKKATVLNTRCEMTVTGGAKIGGLAEIKGEIGGYFEAEAENSEKVMAIISYALYRRFVESKWLPVEMSNFMWGGGTTGKAGYRRAERWASKVEKDIFKGSKAYVETGAVMGVTAQGGIKDVGGVGLGGKVAVKGSFGTRYDEKSITEGKKAQGGLGTTHEYTGRGDAQKNIGRGVYVLEPSLEGSVGPFKLAGKAKLVWLGDPTKTKKWAPLDEWSIEGSGSATLPIHEKALGGLPELAAGFINRSIQSGRKASMEAVGKNPDALGSLMGAAEDATIAAVSLAQIAPKDFVPFKALSGLKEGVAGKGDIGVKITVKYKQKGATKSWEVMVDYVKTGSLGVVDKLLAAQANAMDVFSMKQETSSRLVTWKTEKSAPGAWPSFVRDGELTS
jgi:hypothetical protein